jgi:hypothetical protein
MVKQICSQDKIHHPTFHDKCSLYCFLYSGTFSMAYWQPHKPGEYMSWCNTWPIGGCMIQSMAVWRSQQWLAYSIQYMGETLQGPPLKVRVRVCRGEQGCIPCLSFCLAWSSQLLEWLEQGCCPIIHGPLLSPGNWGPAKEGHRRSRGWSCMVRLGQGHTWTQKRLALLGCGGSREQFLLL